MKSILQPVFFVFHKCMRQIKNLANDIIHKHIPQPKIDRIIFKKTVNTTTVKVLMSLLMQKFITAPIREANRIE